MRNVTPKELNELLHDEDKDELLIDVRSTGEFKGGHIDEAQNIPLDDIAEAADRLKGIGTVYVNCGSGVRSCQATEQLEKCGVNVVNVEGGLTAWLRDGFGVAKDGKGVIPVIRQVMIAAGGLVLLGTILGIIFSPVWMLLAGFTGAGLLFAGISGICMMQKILAKMPWNKS
jgi:rhodanese-related sulfurtransferase